MKINTSHQLADTLVFHYSKYDSFSNNYSLSIKNIPEFDLHELASLIIKEEPELAKEATSVDNPHYETLMLPALIKHMECSTDKSLRNDFDEAWLEGITLYLERTMQNLIDDQCRERAFRQREASNYYPIPNRNTGEIEWRI
jgi:hypothetical protein